MVHVDRRARRSEPLRAASLRTRPTRARVPPPVDARIDADRRVPDGPARHASGHPTARYPDARRRAADGHRARAPAVAPRRQPPAGHDPAAGVAVPALPAAPDPARLPVVRRRAAGRVSDRGAHSPVRLDEPCPLGAAALRSEHRGDPRRVDAAAQARDAPAPVAWPAPRARPPGARPRAAASPRPRSGRARRLWRGRAHGAARCGCASA